jgi:hypothetical protein
MPPQNPPSTLNCSRGTTSTSSLRCNESRRGRSNDELDFECERTGIGMEPFENQCSFDPEKLSSTCIEPRD